VKTKNGAVAIDGPPQGCMNGPVDHSWNRALLQTASVVESFLSVI
jgi:hypothetical protein